MWTPRRLLDSLLRRKRPDPSQAHRERWHERVQRLGPDDGPVELRPFTPRGDPYQGAAFSRKPKGQGKKRLANAGSLAPEDLARRSHEQDGQQTSSSSRRL